jgi:2-(1,2-epoxy-1,2-dihydrophenyl)acetyl-CoA isomerase
MEVSRIIHDIPIPVISALKGKVSGPGLALALASDIRIAAQSTQLTTGFAKLGLSGGYGGVYFLTQLLGSARARELLLMSPCLDAAEGQSMGLVSYVVPTATLESEAFNLAMKLAEGPTTSFGCIKQNVNMAEHASISETLDIEAENHVLCTLTSDHREASKAFRERRLPGFIGV